MIVLIAATIAVVLFTGMSIFQLLLVLGLPYGRLAYGGKYEKLPSKMKIISLIGIVIFIFASLSVLERAEIITIFNNLMFVTVSFYYINECNFKKQMGEAYHDPYITNFSHMLFYSRNSSIKRKEIIAI